MRYRLLLCLFVGCLASVSSWAQQDLNSTVQVSRTYEGRLMEVVKPTLPVGYADSLNRFDLRFDYKFSERPFRDLYEFSPLQSVAYHSEGKLVYPWFYAHIGLAYPWLPVADLYFQPNLGEHWSWVLYGNHSSFWGRVPGQQVNPVTGDLEQGGSRPHGDRMSNHLGTKVTYAWKKGDVSLGFDFGNHYRSYYGSRYGVGKEGVELGWLSDDRSYLRDSLSHNYDIMAVDVQFRSAQPDRHAFYYNVDLKYAQTKDRMNLFGGIFKDPAVENLVEADVGLGMTFQHDHRILLDLKSVNVVSGDAVGLLELVPRYRYERDRWLLDLGLALAGMYAPEDVSLDMAHVYPDVNVYFEAVPSWLWVYARLDGENVLNTRQSMLAVNPWLTPNAPLQISYIPLQGAFGARGVLWNALTFDLACSYGQLCNRLTATGDFYAPVRYEQPVNRFKTMFSLLWKTVNFEGGVEMSYAHYAKDATAVDPMVMMAPAWEGQAFARYNLRERFILSVEAQYRHSVYGDLGKAGVVQLPAYWDVDAKFTYVLNRKYSFYVSGNNLLDASIQYVPGYLEPGINFGLGVCCKF